MTFNAKNLWSCTYLKLFCLSACFVLCFGLFPTESKAEYLVDIDKWKSSGGVNTVMGGGTCGAPYDWDGQVFVASSSVINKLEIGINQLYDYVDNVLEMKVCSGVCDGSGTCASPLKTTLFYLAGYSIGPQTLDTGDSWLADPLNVTTGNSYCIYFQYEGTYDNSDCVTFYSNTVTPEWYNNDSPGTYSLSYRTYYNDDPITDVEIVTDENDIYNYDWGLDDDPNKLFDYVYNQNCISDEGDCYLHFTYNEMIVGNVMELIDATNVDIIYATTTVTYLPMLQNKILLPLGDHDYRLSTYVYIDGYWSRIIGHTVHVEYMTLGEFEEALGFPDDSTLCDDIATSSLAYPFACAIRMAADWLYRPTPATLIKLNEIGELATHQFPISIGWQIKTLLSNATTSTTTAIVVPLRLWDPVDQQYEDMGTLLSSTTLQTGLGFGNIEGQTVYEKFYELLTNLIWLILILYILGRILGLINPSYGASFDIFSTNFKQRDRIQQNTNKIYSNKKDIPVINLK